MANIPGTAGNDFITGTTGDDVIDGLAGNDRLNGNPGADIINGGDGDDALYDGTLTFSLNNTFTHSGDQQHDVLSGGAGDDQIFASAGDSVDGGSGFDILTMSWSLFSQAFTVDLRIVEAGGAALVPSIATVGQGFTQVANGASIAGIERATLTLGMGADVFWGLSAADIVDGGPGDDIMRGLGGNDQFTGGAGNDFVDGGDGDDQFFAQGSAGGGVDTFLGGAGNDIASMTAFVSFDGGEGIDTANIQMGGGAIDLRAMDTGGVGALPSGGSLANVEVINISSMSGALLFYGSNVSESVSTWGGGELHGGGGNDTLGAGPFANADVMFGEAGNDSLNGGTGDDVLAGGAGADYLNGGDGMDTASYADATAGVVMFMTAPTLNAGDAVGDTLISIEALVGSAYADILAGNPFAGDRLSGGAGNDWLLGLDGADTLNGGDGNDVLNGGAGADAMDGGEGLDVAYYREATAGLTVDMTSPAANTGEAAGDTYANIENLWGSDFNDVLVGSASGGQVYGFNGNDNLTGSNSGDVFYGGAGSDSITTGNGADDIFFLKYDEGSDGIVDFAHGVDRITVSRFWFGFGSIDGPAAALTSANADFLVPGQVASARPAFMWNDHTRILSFDPDGSGSAPAVQLARLAGATLTLSDIWTA